MLQLATASSWAATVGGRRGQENFTAGLQVVEHQPVCCDEGCEGSSNDRVGIGSHWMGLSGRVGGRPFHTQARVFGTLTAAGRAAVCVGAAEVAAALGAGAAARSRAAGRAGRAMPPAASSPPAAPRRLRPAARRRCPSALAPQGGSASRVSACAQLVLPVTALPLLWLATPAQVSSSAGEHSLAMRITLSKRTVQAVLPLLAAALAAEQVSSSSSSGAAG